VFTALGQTLGVEEEYHLVAPTTWELLNRPALSVRVATGEVGARLRPEMLTSQIEAATPVCSDLRGLRSAVVAMRVEAAAAAATVDATIFAASTHPFASLADIDLMDSPRYDVLIERFGPVVRQLNLCGCHVHVSVPDVELAVAIMTHARPYLPILAALTASSPYHEGVDTGYDSYRLSQLSLWPQGGAPPYLGSAAEYAATVEHLIALGLISDATMLLWELRPSARYPTLEFRIGDVCTDVDDVVLYAGLVRALVRTLGERVANGRPPANPSDAALRAARWRASRYGLRDNLWSVSRSAMVPAHSAVLELWNEVEAEAEDEQLLGRLLEELLRRGTSATRQRQALGDAADLRDVVRWGVEVTAKGD
jgi:carboxylate-amine ligase